MPATTRVPAARRGGVALRGYDSEKVIRSYRNAL